MNHPSPTLGYKIESQGVSVLYLSDHEPFARKRVAGRRAARAHGIILEAGDRRHAEYMKDADLLVHEAQYTPEEYVTQAQLGPQHLLLCGGVGRCRRRPPRLFLNASRSLA